MNYEYCAGVTYTIKNGDTLYEISRRHGVPLALLLRANPYVDVFSLQAGDTICVPQKTREELPYPMESPMQDSMEAVENAIDESIERTTNSAGMQIGGGVGTNSRTGIQEGLSGDNSSAGMQKSVSESSRSSGVQEGVLRNSDSTGMRDDVSGNNGSSGIQGAISGGNSSAGIQGCVSEGNTSARVQAEMPGQSTSADMQRSGRNHTVSQKTGNEQMDEMLVWSEQANASRKQSGDSPLREKKWCKYVVKPGDTLEDVIQDMDEDMDEFWEKNPASRLYLLPGVAYYVCKE